MARLDVSDLGGPFIFCVVILCTRKGCGVKLRTPTEELLLSFGFCGFFNINIPMYVLSTEEREKERLTMNLICMLDPTVNLMHCQEYFGIWLNLHSKRKV